MYIRVRDIYTGILHMDARSFDFGECRVTLSIFVMGVG